MRILYLAHRVPYPPNKGEKTRVYHHLRHLSASHEVHLLSSVDDPAEAAGADALRRFCRSVELVRLRHAPALARAAAALLGGGSLSAAYFDAGALRRAVERAAARGPFDLAWASSSAAAVHLEGARPRRRIVDFIDIDSEKWREFARFTGLPVAWAYRVEASRLARLETRIAAAADCVLLASQPDAELLRTAVPHAPLRVVENGVDTDFFQPMAAADGAAPLRVVFTGTLDYRPNVDAVRFFLDQVLPLLRQRVPEVEFTAVGHRPAPAVQRAARRAGGAVEVAGSVPDVRPYFAAAEVCVAPLRFGRGVKNKVLEAMAMGVPVVASRVAAQGLAVRDGTHLLLADGAADLADAVGGLLRDPARRRALATAALQYVREFHRWEDRLRELDDVLNRLA
jgi:sugar transferase (PEP-CTERM/EpsH1 system associated)